MFLRNSETRSRIELISLAFRSATLTRMHSSRMRAGHSLTVCRSLLPGGYLLPGGGSAPGGLSAPKGSLLRGGVSAPGGCLHLGGVCSWGVSAPWGCVCPRGVCSRGMSAPGGVGGVVSQHALRQTAPLWTESQTPVKTLPWPNFIAAGNKYTRMYSVLV